MSPSSEPHLLLGRIRFITRCTECFRRSEPLPDSLCFVPKEVCYKVCRDSSSSSAASSSSASAAAAGSGGLALIPVWDSPHQAPSRKSCKLTIEPKKGTCIRTSGEEYYNSHGLWVRITKVPFTLRTQSAATSGSASRVINGIPAQHGSRPDPASHSGLCTSGCVTSLRWMFPY